MTGKPMDKDEFNNILTELGLTQAEIARLMKVSDRTVRRWAATPLKMYAPAREALRAWLKCHRYRIDWGNRIYIDLVAHQ